MEVIGKKIQFLFQVEIIQKKEYKISVSNSISNFTYSNFFCPQLTTTNEGWTTLWEGAEVDKNTVFFFKNITRSDQSDVSGY